ncbi:hypothetical protein SUGI_0036680 [Cryptomeria japonica]|nr:hypothetical protein SUGI_0036680 [Cryptomeria japonica]
MHHYLGDGTFLMSLFFCCVARAEDPNLPPTFPFSKSGLPQTLVLTVVSYMGSIWLEVIGMKGYVNSDSLA